MQASYPTTLTPAAHTKIKGNGGELILQIVEVSNEDKNMGDDVWRILQISDGNCKMKGYFLADQVKTTPAIDLYNSIIKLEKISGDPRMVLVYQFSILGQYPRLIGNPVDYKTYAVKYGPNTDMPIHKINSADFVPTVAAPTTVLTGSTKLSQASEKSNSTNVRTATNQQNEALTPRRRNQPFSSDSLNQIAELYPGLQGDWRIACRVLKCSYREFENKKGSMTKLLQLLLVDRKNSKIKATIFGDHATKKSKDIEAGQIYLFSKGVIKIDSYRPHNADSTLSDHTLMFNQYSVINPIMDDNSIVNEQTRYLSVKDLMNKNENDQVDVVAILKELRPAASVSCKDGRTIYKRVGQLLDPENKVEIDVTFWNSLVELDPEYLHKTLLFTEFKMREYNGGISLNSAFKSTVLPFPNHPYSKYENRVFSIMANNISFKGSRGDGNPTSNIREMTIAAESMPQEGSTWSQLRVRLNKIKEKGKRDYLGCPHCKKTVPESSTECDKCRKTYPRPQARYILSVNVADSSGAFWTTAYDDFAEQIFRRVGDLPADVVHNYSDQEFSSLVNKCLYQEFRIKVVSKYEIVQNARRLKHSITSFNACDFVEQTKLNLEYIRKRA